MTPGQEERLRNFRCRAAVEPEGARTLRAGGEIVLIHPLADDHELLAQLGVSPESCSSVDGYWSVAGDAVFLRVSTVDADPFRGPGLYARVPDQTPNHVNLVVVVEDRFITFETVERAARELLEIGWERSKLGDALVSLAKDA